MLLISNPKSLIMKINKLHSWNISAKEAIKLQNSLKSHLIIKRIFRKIHFIAGADMSIDKNGEMGLAGVIVYSYPDLKEVERCYAKAPLKFPYVPGLLAFREAPVLIKAFAKVKCIPDVIMFDGQGIAHPRGLGIASHMGLILGKPTIGCAKSRLIGEYDEPGPNVGDWAPLKKSNALSLRALRHKSVRPEQSRRVNGRSGQAPRSNPMGLLRSLKGPRNDFEGKIIGAVLRTRKNVKPIFVSVGHLIDLAASVKIVLASLDRTRIPKPTREADKFVAQIKRKIF